MHGVLVCCKLSHKPNKLVFYLCKLFRRVQNMYIFFRKEKYDCIWNWCGILENNILQRLQPLSVLTCNCDFNCCKTDKVKPEQTWRNGRSFNSHLYYSVCETITCLCAGLAKRVFNFHKKHLVLCSCLYRKKWKPLKVAFSQSVNKEQDCTEKT